MIQSIYFTLCHEQPCIKHEYLRPRAYKCLSLSSSSSSNRYSISEVFPLSRFSCLYLGSCIHEFFIKYLWVSQQNCISQAGILCFHIWRFAISANFFYNFLKLLLLCESQMEFKDYVQNMNDEILIPFSWLILLSSAKKDISTFSRKSMELKRKKSSAQTTFMKVFHALRLSSRL